MVALLAVLTTPASAHHSVLGFDNTRGVTLRGVVKDFHWADPHTYITVAIAGRGGRDEGWRIESESAIVLRRLGWDRRALPAGTEVEVVGARARDGTRVMRCDTVTPKGLAPLACYPR